MSVDKKIKYDMQGGVRNYLGKQKEIKAPLKWQSSPNHPSTELAYITQAEKNLLVKQDLHGSLNGKPNKGPSGIISLNGGGFGSEDKGTNDDGSANSGNDGREVGAIANQTQSTTTTTTSPSTTHNPHTDSGYSTTSTPTKSKTKTPTGPTNIHNDDPNAPEAYEIIGGVKFDVTPDTIDERERARVKQSILDAPIPNITDKGISFFKDGNLLSNSFMPGDDPLGKPKFSMGNFLLNAGMFAINPGLFAKYRKAKSLYSGAKFVTDTLSNLTGKNVSKPFQTVEKLTKDIGLKDKNVIESFKNSLTNNLVSKSKPILTPKRKPVINTNTDDNSNDGIVSLEKMDLLQDEYKTLLQKGNLNDEEQVRFNMLKNMLGI